MRRLLFLSSLAALLALVLGCTEGGALPTEPTDPGAANPWTVVYPLLVNTSLYAAWGMDTDDMWAVGTLGVILHWDGERCTRVESPVDDEISDIHGRARDDIWAVSDDQVLHWDGSRWRVVHTDPGETDLEAIWCADTGEVFAGGRNRSERPGDAAVLRFDGARWWRTNLSGVEEDRARFLWQPAPGGPVLMGNIEGLYRYDNSRWLPTATQIEVRDVNGTVAIGVYPGDDTPFLFRFDATGEPFAPCPDESLKIDWRWASAIADSRVPVANIYNTFRLLDADCRSQDHPEELDEYIHDLAVPQHLGPDSPVLFATGTGGLFARGVWNADRSIDWQVLVPGPTAPLLDAITGTADLVFGDSGNDQILVREQGTWRVEAFDGIPYGAELEVQRDGTLAAWNHGEIAIRRPSGEWYALPDPPGSAYRLWTDGEFALMYDSHLREWTLADGHWTQTDSLTVPLDHLAGRSADEIYRQTYPGILERKVGDHWEAVFGDETDRVWRFYLSPFTDDIYLYLVGPNYDGVTAVLRDGILTVLTEDDDGSWRPDSACEVRPGEFYKHFRSEIWRLADGAWHMVPFDDEIIRIDDLWGHPDQGLFVLDTRGRLHHRSFTESGAP